MGRGLVKIGFFWYGRNDNPEIAKSLLEIAETIVSTVQAHIKKLVSSQSNKNEDNKKSSPVSSLPSYGPLSLLNIAGVVPATKGISMSSIPEHQYKLQAFAELQQYHQWVCYIFVSRGQKITKPPMNPNVPEFPPRKERMADVTIPATWAPYEATIAAWIASKTYKGIGFVLTAQDPFCAVDLDHCIDPKTFKIAPWARRILKLLNSYSEVSALGTGIHIFVRASLHETAQALGIADPNAIKHKKGDVELYDRERYLTWNGKHIKGTPEAIEERQDQINELYFELFYIEEEKKDEAEQRPAPPTQPLPQAIFPNDATLIRLAENARGHNGRLFSQLWSGNLTSYRKKDSNEIDYSRADLALCSILAYWTQKDATRIDRLFRQSALYQPEDRKKKWDRPARGGETYGEGTIRIAIAQCLKVYDPSWRPVEYNEYREKLRKLSFPQASTPEASTEERGARS
jgi:putative DNA primase/helicase